MAGQRILFIRLRSLGDTVLMTPALRVAKRNPENVVAVVSEEPFHQVLAGNPCVDCLLTARRQAKWPARLALLQRIRRFRADVVFDLHGGSTSAMLTFLSGAGRRVGYAESRHARCYNLRVPPSPQVWGREGLHTVEHQLTPLRVAGFDVEPIPPLQVAVDDAGFSELMAQHWEIVQPGDFVLLHPAAAFATKQWPIERFAQLAERLLTDGIRVVATAGPGEASLLEMLDERGRGRLAIIPPLPLNQFVALASQCRLYVGNDTGTTHIAAALGKPIVAIFGSSNATAWHPWGVSYRLLKSELPCIPCPGYTCSQFDEPRCIQQVGVDEVDRAVRELLG